MMAESRTMTRRCTVLRLALFLLYGISNPASTIAWALTDILALTLLDRTCDVLPELLDIFIDSRQSMASRRDTRVEHPLLATGVGNCF